MRIYLDNCCYNRSHDDQRQIRIALETQAIVYIKDLIVSNKLDLVISYVSIYENDDNPHSDSRISIADFFSNAIDFIDIDKSELIELRLDEFAKHGLKRNDALHLSCAIETKCDYFITVDDGILRYNSSETKISDPINFVKILEEKNA